MVPRTSETIETRFTALRVGLAAVKQLMTSHPVWFGGSQGKKLPLCEMESPAEAAVIADPEKAVHKVRAARLLTQPLPKGG